MPIVTDRESVLEIYKKAEQEKWTLPCFCTENLTTTEAILAAAKEYSDEISVKDIPVIIAITNQYDHRTQSAYYTHTRRWDIGLKLFLNDLKVLTDKGTPYEHLKVMVHLDHIQFDDDKELLLWDLNEFSSIMFDASKVNFSENIKLTSQFVKKYKQTIVIEGACDEIVDATGSEKSSLTTEKKAEEYLLRTGVDLVVANLGTEHRAGAKDLRYCGDYAKKIKKRIGTKIVLHGASSVSNDKIADLIDDGICKVNIWTTLERDSSPVLLKAMVENAQKVAGSAVVDELKDKLLLGEKCESLGNASINYFTTAYRQNIIFLEMKKIVKQYFALWYKM